MASGRRGEAVRVDGRECVGRLPRMSETLGARARIDQERLPPAELGPEPESRVSLGSKCLAEGGQAKG